MKRCRWGLPYRRRGSEAWRETSYSGRAWPVASSDRVELRLGNGLDFGAPLAEVAAEEGEGNDGADEDGEGREWKNRIHWRTMRIGLGCEGLIRVEFWGK